MIHNQSVALIVTPDYWFYQVELCKLLKKRYGAQIHIYVGGEQAKKFVHNTYQPGSYDSVTIHNFQNTPYRVNLNEDEVLKKSLFWEKELGLNLTHLIMTNRHYGRAYSLGAFNFPRADIFVKNDHIRVLEIYNNEIEFWDKELREKEITLFLNPMKVQAVLCDKYNIQHRYFVGAYFEDYYYWAKSEYFLNHDFEKNFNLVKDEVFEPIVMEEGCVNDMAFRRNFFKNNGLKRFFYRFYFKVKKKLITILRPQDGKGTHFIDGVKRDLRILRDARRMLKSRLITPFEEIEKHPYFYYPLQTEPEWTMQVQSPDFFSQLWSIALCAKAMPANTRIAVKEHIYPIGIRPDNFYDQITDFKNIDMVSAQIHGLRVMRQSKGVISIKGTSGYEAAMTGKPSIVLATQCDFAFLDHVFHCPKGEGLEEAIRKIMNDEVDLEKAVQDGARFAEAIRRSSFRVHDYSLVDRETVPPEMVEDSIQALVNSL